MSFRKAFFAERNAGFSILEGMVGAVVGGLVIYGLSAGMTQSLRVAKSVEMKTEVNDFQQLLSLSLSTSENAMKMLQADGEVNTSMKKLPGSFDALPQKDARCDERATTGQNLCLQIPLTKLKLVDGLVYESNRAIGGNLKFQSAKLVIVNMTSEKVPASLSGPNQRREYYGKLHYTLSRSKEQKGGFEAYSKFYPMLVEIEKTGDSTLKLVSAYGVGQNDEGSEVCEKMGGTWLSNSEKSSYFPRERCHFGGAIPLSSTEWPDGVPIDGTTTSDGVRLESCKYMSSSTIATYACPGFRAGKTAGWLCRYDKSAGQWKKAYYLRTTTGDNAGQLVFTSETICSKGVIASKSSDSVTLLDFDETLAGAFPGSSGSGKSQYFSSSTFDMKEFLEEADRLHTVLRCKTDQNKDVWFNCLNPSDPGLARAGGVNTCIYVRGAKVTSLASLGTAGEGKDKNDFTGWIKVTGARTFSTVPAPNTAITNIAEPRLVEATGIPCFEVEVNPAAYSSGEFLPAPASRGNDSSPDDVTSVDANSLQMKNVTQCLVQLRDKAATPVHRHTVLSCAKNETLDGDPNSWTNIIRDTDDFQQAIEDLGIDLDPEASGIPAFRSIEEIDNLIAKITGTPGNAYPSSATLSPAFNCIPGNTAQNCAKLGLRRTDGGVESCVMTNKLYTKWPAGLNPCATQEFEDGLPTGFANLSQLRATIYNKMQALTKADPDVLGLQNCGYFKYVRVTGYAEAQFTATTAYPASGKRKSGHDVAGKEYTGFYNAGASPTPTWLSSAGIGSTANFGADLKGAFTGWLFLKSAIPAWFRTESGTLASNFTSTNRTMTPSGTQVPIFVQIENLAGAHFPPLAPKTRTWNAYYPLNTGTTSFLYGTAPQKSVPNTRPTVSVPGIPCNMGIRTKTR
jgi:hypothetical protein